MGQRIFSQRHTKFSMEVWMMDEIKILQVVSLWLVDMVLLEVRQVYPPLEWKLLRSQQGPCRAVGRNFSLSCSGSYGMHGEKRGWQHSCALCPIASGQVESGAHSTVPKSVHFPSFLGLLENWDQHVTFAWKGESWCSMHTTPLPQCPVAHQDTGAPGKQKVIQPGSLCTGWVCEEQLFWHIWSFMIPVVFSTHHLIQS